jgi:hypothetical protein
MMTRAQRIRLEIANVIATTTRPIETRKMAKRISSRLNVSVFSVWGVLSGMSRSNAVRFVVRVPGGPSYIR